MQHCTQRVFLLSMKYFIMYCRSEFLHALLMNQLWVWSAALLLWSSHLLWCGHGGSGSFWVDEVWEPWDSCDLSSARFILSWSPTKCLEHSSTWMPVLFAKRHSQICRTLGKFYTPAFPLGLWEGWEKCWNYPSFTQNHTLLFLQSQPLAYIAYMIYFFTHDPHFFKKLYFPFMLVLNIIQDSNILNCGTDKWSWTEGLILMS